MPVDWEVGTDGDLTITSGDIVLVDEALRVAQAVSVELQLFRGEWFLDTNSGTPYFQNIFGRKVAATVEEFDAVIKAQVLSVDDVNRILAYESSFNRATREYVVAFTADTTFGPIEYGGILP